jgi:hypothetical protein
MRGWSVGLNSEAAIANTVQSVIPEIFFGVFAKVSAINADNLEVRAFNSSRPTRVPARYEKIY